ncbi:hypothetical protein [Leptolyngbya iicbica]|uniref:Uncharacterized protein n=2 Tax=Cyanophyceae TaxID=3028117 RepID=A0A4Q7E264_9CYAN|nr:hypothetical protein [Leptolyngbya sp. LK]RZM76500.1 hypothetical protein DYY88_17670 [Leptolyngbya sp. LK]
MLKIKSQFSKQLVRVALISVLVLGLGLLGNPSRALASSKVATPEALNLAINEAAQEFVESILDDYGDILESSFDTAYDPFKTAVKSLSKQISKAEKSAQKAGEEATTPTLMIPEGAFQSAVDAFSTLQETTAGFKAQLESAPEVVQALIDEQVGAKMDALDQAIAEVSTVVDQLAADVAGLDAADPSATATFNEHATALTQSIQAVDLAIDGFDS